MGEGFSKENENMGNLFNKDNQLYQYSGVIRRDVFLGVKEEKNSYSTIFVENNIEQQIKEAQRLQDELNQRSFQNDHDYLKKYK
jgi:hypothetical protein